MRGIIWCFLCYAVFAGHISCIRNDNVTLDPASRQLLDFKLEHPVPIGLWTKSSGEPVEVRDTMLMSTHVFDNQLILDSLTQLTRERVPERIVHAKGTGAYGYFEVTNDVSKYTYADVFSDIGKKTPLVVRFSTSVESSGGNDVSREAKGLAVKMYTKEGNLDFTCLHTPVYFYKKNPLQFTTLVHSFKRNPATNLIDLTARWDALLTNPAFAHTFFWLLSDIGIPNGYRRTDYFPIHTYELANKHAETHYVRFNFRTEQEIQTITTAQAQIMAGQDPDYFTRDLYNAIERKEYPSWRLEMDVMTPHDLEKVDYDPFDVTRTWKNGTYFTVQIGRMVLNKNVENVFEAVEQGAYNPSHLVPGIPGPVDLVFKSRKMFYRDTQNYRLGRNHNRIKVNMPLYAKTINRDGKSPLRDNEGDAPNYYPNSFNGIIPYVDERVPREKLLVMHSKAEDLQPLADFYNIVLGDDAHRQRFVSNTALFLVPVVPKVRQNVVKFLYLVDQDLGKRVEAGLEVALAQAMAEQIAQTSTTTTIKPIIVSKGENI